MVPPPQRAPAAEGVVGALPIHPERGHRLPASIDNAGILTERAKRIRAGPAWRPPFPSPGEDWGRSGHLGAQSEASDRRAPAFNRDWTIEP
jgi:hypothetical protein